jgi:hypothetical protein
VWGGQSGFEMKKEGCVSGFMEGVLLALVLPYLRRRRMGAVGRSISLLR